MPSPLTMRGASEGVSLRYDVPLKRAGRLSHGVYAGFDYKRSDNNLLFSSMPVTDTVTEIYQGAAGYSATWPDAYGQTSAGVNVFYSPGGTGSSNTDAAFAATRAGAQARYDYETLSVTRTTFLPARWTWTVALQAQRASGNLLGSEQLSGGGFNSVRGYADAIAFGDEGHVLRTELVAPPLDFGVGGTASRVQALVFYDEARLKSADPLPGEDVRFLSSVGVGLRVAYGRSLSLRLDAGHQLRTRVPGAALDNIVHIGLALSL